jgi:predicted amidohydrolase
MKGRFTVAAAQYPLTRLGSWDEYARSAEGWVAGGAGGGASLLVFPEYASLELVSLIPGHQELCLGQQLAALQELYRPYDELYRYLAKKYNVFMLAGSFPLLKGGRYFNTAPFFFPDGEAVPQEKRIMTVYERNVLGISSGRGPAVIDCELGRLCVAICYDSEFPLLVRRPVEAGADVVLVPSCTDTLAGYWRVRIACQARALENQCYVVQSPTVGSAGWCAAIEENVGAAGVLGPPDVGFPADGVVASGELNKPGWVYGEVDLEAVRRVRAEGDVLNHRHWKEQLSK